MGVFDGLTNELIINVDNIIKWNDIHIGSYDLCLWVKYRISKMDMKI